jgi:hypothetical protein
VLRTVSSTVSVRSVASLRTTSSSRPALPWRRPLLGLFGHLDLAILQEPVIAIELAGGDRTIDRPALDADMLLAQIDLLADRALLDVGAHPGAAALDFALADLHLLLDDRDALLGDSALLLHMLLGMLLLLRLRLLPGGPAFAAPLLLALVEVDAAGLVEDSDRLVGLVLVDLGAEQTAAAAHALLIGRAVLVRHEGFLERRPEAAVAIGPALLGLDALLRLPALLLIHDLHPAGIDVGLGEALAGRFGFAAAVEHCGNRTRHITYSSLVLPALIPSRSRTCASCTPSLQLLRPAAKRQYCPCGGHGRRYTCSCCIASGRID